jgi:hypothetical protein
MTSNEARWWPAHWEIGPDHELAAGEEPIGRAGESTHSDVYMSHHMDALHHLLNEMVPIGRHRA